MVNGGSTMNKSKDSIHCAPQKKKTEELERHILRDKSKDKASFNPSRSFYDDSKLMATESDIMKTQNSYYGQQQTKPYFKDHRVSQKNELDALREKQVNLPPEEKDLRKSIQGKTGMFDQGAKSIKSYLGAARKEQPATQMAQNTYGLARKKTISDLSAAIGNENLYGQRQPSSNQGQLVRNKSIGKSPLVK